MIVSKVRFPRNRDGKSGYRVQFRSFSIKTTINTSPMAVAANIEAVYGHRPPKIRE